MSKREHSSQDDEKLPNEDTFKRLKRSQTSVVEDKKPISQKDEEIIKIPNLVKMKTLSSKDTVILDDIEEDKQDDVHESSHEATDESGSEMSYYSDEETEGKNRMRNRKLKDMPNLMFYLNKMMSRPQGDYIDNIHKYWRTDYKKLEVHHGYIQWLFPNFYGSAFNRDAFKLLPEEANIFRENKEIAERLVKSYELILGFFGMVLADKKTGRLERAPNYEERYKATLITSLHNHLRVRRILAHLNVVGFRLYAIELVNFLEKEMFGEIGGYKKFMDQPRPLSSEYLKKLKGNPLYAIIKYDVFKDWKIYGEVTNEEERRILYQNCFTSDEKDYEPSIILRS